jgi:uncharacterized C2H2 Zn-finger protein
MSTQIKLEQNKKLDEVTEKILKGIAFITSTHFHTTNFIKCRGKYAEKIEGRTRAAFVRCPKCDNHISVYRDELVNDKGWTKNKRCLCGFSKHFVLENWKK